MAKKKAEPKKDDDTVELERDDLAEALKALPPEAEPETETTEGDPEAVRTMALPRQSGLIRTVLARLSGDGVKASGVGEVLALVMLVVQVIEDLKPLVSDIAGSVEEIVRRVKELWAKK